MNSNSDRAAPHRHALLGHARRIVTIDDIAAYATCIDPGYQDYVDHLTQVLRSNEHAGIDQVDWEPVFHATRNNDDLERASDPRRFRCYRVFVAAIGALHPGLGDWLAPSALTVSLIEDVAALAEHGLSTASYLALDELSAVLRDDAPFATLASLLIASAAPLENVDLSALAVRVFDEEATRRHPASPKQTQPRFLLGSCNRAERDRWVRCIETYLPSSTQSLASLRTVLLRTLTAV